MNQQAPIDAIPVLLERLSKASESEVAGNYLIKDLGNPKWDRVEILSSISISSQHPLRSLRLLYTILTTTTGSWPTLSLIRCHSRLAKRLHKELDSNLAYEAARLISTTSNAVKQSYSTLSDLIASDARPALRGTTLEEYITYQGLYNFVTRFKLPTKSSQRRPVVAIALPNGPLLAATCIAVTTYYTAAPINPAAGPEQFQADILQAGAKFILTSLQEYRKLKLNDEWLKDADIEVSIVEWKGGDDIRILHPTGESTSTQNERDHPNRADDVGLILFTSGTSGTRKVVPITLHSIITGVVSVMDSWGLNSQDICLNMMPLYHV